MCMSVQNKHPDPKDCDFKCRGKYASVDLKKDLNGVFVDTLLYISLTSKVGLKILFAY